MVTGARKGLLNRLHAINAIGSKSNVSGTEIPASGAQEIAASAHSASLPRQRRTMISALPHLDMLRNVIDSLVYNSSSQSRRRRKISLQMVRFKRTNGQGPMGTFLKFTLIRRAYSNQIKED